MHACFLTQNEIGDYWHGINSTIISHCLNETASFTPKGIDSFAKFVSFLNTFLPGSDLETQRGEIIKQYNCTETFQGDYTACISAVIRDASFTCNTRDLFEAFPSQSHMMRYGFPLPELAHHGSDLVALFSNNYDEAYELLLKNGLTALVATLYARLLVNTQVSSVYQTYFASFAVTGNPNKLARPDLPRGPATEWPVANGTGNELTDVLTVRNPSGEEPFVLGSDDQNEKNACAFWTDLAKEIVSAHESQQTGSSAYDEL
jgi:carboxylesterase type B